MMEEILNTQEAPKAKYMLSPVKDSETILFQDETVVASKRITVEQSDIFTVICTERSDDEGYRVISNVLTHEEAKEFAINLLKAI